MRAVVQRVTEAAVRVDGTVVGAIGHGLLVLVGVAADDTDRDADYLADKVAGLRCFRDDASKFNRSVADVGGSVLAVSQFTLFGDCRKGRRPSFTDAGPPEIAVPLYERFVASLRAKGVPVETGEFGADMKVSLVNDGPVTLMLDSRRRF